MKLPNVYVTERGFGISTNGSAAWNELDVWKTHELQKNSIGSVSALTATRTAAATSADSALAVVDDILSFVKETPGKPSKKERALLAAAVVFMYGVWESFTEQLALEVATQLSKAISEHKVPDAIKNVLQKKTAWGLAVSPGWRELWREHVKLEALGDEADRHGMNTARAGNVKRLLALAGSPDPFKTFPASAVPQHVRATANTAEKALDALVSLRGEIAHTGKVPEPLRKQHVNAWYVFVADLVDVLDQAGRNDCGGLLSK